MVELKLLHNKELKIKKNVRSIRKSSYNTLMQQVLACLYFGYLMFIKRW